MESKNNELEGKGKKLEGDDHVCDSITILRKSLEETETVYQSVVSKLATVERSEKSKQEKITYMEEERASSPGGRFGKDVWRERQYSQRK